MTEPSIEISLSLDLFGLEYYLFSYESLSSLNP